MQPKQTKQQKENRSDTTATQRVTKPTKEMRGWGGKAAGKQSERESGIETGAKHEK